MVRLNTLTEVEAGHLRDLECPTYETNPWVKPRPLQDLRLALISTAGLHRPEDRPFLAGAKDYRVIPGDVDPAKLVMSHISTNYDRTGFLQDVGVVFPLERLRELVAEGVLGSLAGFHYSFMGATHPRELESTARHLAGLLQADGVEAALLAPV